MFHPSGIEGATYESQPTARSPTPALRSLDPGHGLSPPGRRVQSRQAVRAPGASALHRGGRPGSRGVTANLRVGGLVPLTTLDFPDHLACVLFCQGCGWRCRYCHNPQLIPARGEQEKAWADILAFLEQRVGLLDAVVFSGGEPTLQAALPEAIAQVRALGFKVGLHSAGIKPKRFAKVLPLVDWVGFDIKAAPEYSTAITGVDGSGAANWHS